MKLKIKKLDKDAKTPEYSYEDDAAFDLFALEEVSIEKGDRAQIKTGIALEIPKGYVGLIWDKSGISHKGGIKTMGGVIDSGYRGEVLIGMINLSDSKYIFEKGHKVAQMIIQKKETPEIIEVEELDDSNRGDKGFGSSGK